MVDDFRIERGTIGQNFVYFSCRNEVYNSTNKLHMEGFNHTYYTQMSTHLFVPKTSDIVFIQQSNNQQ